MVKFPVLEIVGKMIIDRLDKARIKFLNIDNKIEW